MRSSPAPVVMAMLAVAACGGGREGRSVPPAASAAAAADRRTGGPADSPSAAPVIVFLGTSLTAGLGLDEDEAYPALIQQKIDSAGLRYRVINAGVSGETSAGGLRRIDWLLRQPIAVLVIELGANDGLRGQDIDSMRTNIQRIIDRTRATHPGTRIVIAGMEAPPNMGRAFTDRFRRVFPELARANGAALIPFLLDGVAAVPTLNQSDGIHPTAAGQRIVAENVWKVVQPVLEEREERQ